MPDFTHLLRKPSGQAAKPAALPVGDYPGVIASFEYGDANKNKTPYVRLQLKPVDWPADMPEGDKEQQLPDGTSRPIELGKRTLRRDFYLTEDALHRLDDLIRSCGIEPGRMYDEIIPELQGKDVIIEIKQRPSQDGEEMFNDVGKVTGVGR